MTFRGDEPRAVATLEHNVLACVIPMRVGAGAPALTGAVPGGVARIVVSERERGLDISATPSPKMQKAALPAAVTAWVETRKGLACQCELK